MAIFRKSVDTGGAFELVIEDKVSKKIVPAAVEKPVKAKEPAVEVSKDWIEAALQKLEPSAPAPRVTALDFSPISKVRKRT